MSPERNVTYVSGMDIGRDGALERTRTSDPQLRKLMLYPLSYERVRGKRIPYPLTHGPRK